jgi:dTDP-4-dehydrorhamnose reductase
MRTLLLGANGQVGWELQRSLAGLGDLVTTARTGPADQVLDTTDLRQLHRTLDTVKPDLIVNATAYTAVDKAENERDLAMLVNGTVPEHLGIWAAHHGATVIHYSTDYVFDGTKETPYLETDTPNPINVYGRTKLAGDEAVLGSGCLAFILRVSWVYGLRGSNFLLTIKRLLSEHAEVRVVGDQVGAPTWCRTIAEITASVIESHRATRSTSIASGICNCAPLGSTSWFGFASAIRDIVPGDSRLSEITSAEYPTQARRPSNSRLDLNKLKSTTALPNWREALDHCLAIGA